MQHEEHDRERFVDHTQLVIEHLPTLQEKSADADRLTVGPGRVDGLEFDRASVGTEGRKRSNAVDERGFFIVLRPRVSQI